MNNMTVEMVASDFGAAHRKGRKERKAQPQCGTWMTWIQRIFTDPRKSASSAQSAFHHVCSSLKNAASGTKISAFIRRLNIIFWYEKNHREHRGHREKWQPSAFSVYSVVDYLCKYESFEIYDAVRHESTSIKYII
ncbi:MAG: hypothetical protein Q8M95_15915 [Candidatus Methanoperedens sp.]|nr:hypothetical protein [Candidatus Methanoperedens sp.]